MAAFTIYDVLRHLVEKSSWSTEQDRTAAMESIREAEQMSVLGNAARLIECPHAVLSGGVCDDCGRTIEVGLSPAVPRSPVTRQGWR